jgi:hypothetical protein
MGKFISGLPTTNNLDRWRDYAKRNSYGDNKRHCRDQLDSAVERTPKMIGPMTGRYRNVREKGGPEDGLKIHSKHGDLIALTVPRQNSQRSGNSTSRDQLGSQVYQR